MFLLAFGHAAASLAVDGKPASSTLEQRVKAAFLFNFARFVEWPGDDASLPPAENPLVIGVIGKDSFSRSIKESLAGETVSGRPLIVKEFERIEPGEKMHILFIGKSNTGLAAVQSLQQSPVLTVSDKRDFLDKGGMVRLATVNGRVQFFVDAAAMEKSGLKASSQMLQYAKKKK